MSGEAAVPRLRVLIADDHPAVLDQVRRLLEPQFEVAGVAANGWELVDQASSLHPDVVVTDVAMPGMSGLEASEILLAANPRLPILLLTMHGDDEIARRALRAGVRGFVLKIHAGDELVEAVSAVARGDVFVSQTVSILGF